MNLSNTHATVQREAFHRVHRNFFVGIFILIPVVLIPILVLFTLAKSEFFQDKYTLRVRYENSYGLNRNSLVTVSGIRVGYVDRVRLCGDASVEVTMKVARKYIHLVRKDSQALLKQKSMVVGDWEIELTRGNPLVAPVSDGDSLAPSMPLKIDQIIEQAKSMLVTTQAILEDIHTGKGLIGKLISSDTVSRQVADLMSDIRRLVGTTQLAIGEARGAISDADMTIKAYGRIPEKGVAAVDTLIGAIRQVEPLLGDARLLLSSVDVSARKVPDVLERVKADLEELNVILRALQEHPLLKGSVKKVKASGKTDSR